MRAGGGGAGPPPAAAPAWSDSCADHILNTLCCCGVGVTIFEVLVEGRLLFNTLRIPLASGMTVSRASDGRFYLSLYLGKWYFEEKNTLWSSVKFLSEKSWTALFSKITSASGLSLNSMN